MKGKTPNLRFLWSYHYSDSNSARDRTSSLTLWGFRESWKVIGERSQLIKCARVCCYSYPCPRHSEHNRQIMSSSRRKVSKFVETHRKRSERKSSTNWILVSSHHSNSMWPKHFWTSAFTTTRSRSCRLLWGKNDNWTLLTICVKLKKNSVCKLTAWNVKIFYRWWPLWPFVWTLMLLNLREKSEKRLW